MSDKQIWTIGHSTHTEEEFLEMLKSFEIKNLVDVRSLPGSRKFPQFNKEHLEIIMPENGIHYFHFLDLGGRRKVAPNSLNTSWRNTSFQAYADYMETDEFKKALPKLEKLALEKRTAFFCSEAVWWRCHRSMISDELKAEGWEVCHIMSVGKSMEHPYTQPAKIIDGKLTYQE
ncbi:DUF488 family protein [Halpernia sp.]|uniref:DUF488 domain-containing protein n=1 Tax=Halpernia sp. TaxID=2782209 RepID=UPI003A927EC1